MFISVCLYACMYVCAYMFVYMYVCMYVYMYEIWMCVCINAFIYLYMVLVGNVLGLCILHDSKKRKLPDADAEMEAICALRQTIHKLLAVLNNELRKLRLYNHHTEEIAPIFAASTTAKPRMTIAVAGEKVPGRGSSGCNRSSCSNHFCSSNHRHQSNNNSCCSGSNSSCSGKDNTGTKMADRNSLCAVYRERLELGDLEVTCSYCVDLIGRLLDDMDSLEASLRSLQDAEAALSSVVTVPTRSPVLAFKMY